MRPWRSIAYSFTGFFLESFIDECARAALFLVSDYASAVTGAALDANGGAYMP